MYNQDNDLLCCTIETDWDHDGLLDMALKSAYLCSMIAVR
jgi:hypothetical protein